MKKVGELMKEAGFNPKASTSVQEAYIKHLIKAATGVTVTTPSEKKEIAAHPEKVLSMQKPALEKALHSPRQPKLPQQLAFDFEENSEPIKTPKKASTF